MSPTSDGVSPPELLPVRMLNEFTYCPRLFHLEWVQTEWADNAETLDGSRVHQRVDQRSRRGLPEGDDDPPPVIRSVLLSGEDLGLVAKVDLVEADADGYVVPVDFKRSRAPAVPEGAHEPERVQLCAQALLLRAHGYRCAYGELYFAGSRRRVRIDIDDALVERTLSLRDEARAAATAPEPPPPLIDSPKCPGCSLVKICLPDEQNFLNERAEHVRRIIPPTDDALPLHVTSQGTKIGKSGQELVITPRDGEPRRVRLMDVASVQIHGAVEITTPALRLLMTANVPVSFYSQGSWYYGRAVGTHHKNVGIRIAQYALASDPERSLTLARRFVRAKIRNSRTFIRRNASEALDDPLSEFDKALEAVERQKSLSSLLGIEGHAARVYFAALPGAIRAESAKHFDFRGRNRRPPRDPVNALLSFTYALLTTTWTNTLSSVGLDPFLGFYHQPKYGRPALALDMMEEYRSTIADSTVISVLNRGIVTERDFDRARTGVALRAPARKRVIAAFERRLDEQIRHPVFGYRMSYRRIFDVQARLLGRYLVGEIREFPELRPR